MPAATGTIKIIFWANYPDNTIGYSIDGVPQPPISVNCPNAGNPTSVQCGVDIPVNVVTESCDNIVFEGYIESDCNTQGALGQVPWRYEFVGNGGCEPYILTCTDIDGCDGFDPGINCDNADYIPAGLPLIPDLPYNTSVRICYNPSIYIPTEFNRANPTNPTALPRGYELTLDSGCCYECTRLVITLSASDAASGAVQLIYTDCATKTIFVKPLTQINNIIGNCIVTDSWTLINNIDPPTITTYAAICP